MAFFFATGAACCIRLLARNREPHEHQGHPGESRGPQTVVDYIRSRIHGACANEPRRCELYGRGDALRRSGGVWYQGAHAPPRYMPSATACEDRHDASTTFDLLRPALNINTYRYPEQPALLRFIARALLFSAGQIQRYLMLPRTKAKSLVPIGKPTSPYMHPSR